MAGTLILISAYKDKIFLECSDLKAHLYPHKTLEELFIILGFSNGEPAEKVIKGLGKAALIHHTIPFDGKVPEHILPVLFSFITCRKKLEARFEFYLTRPSICDKVFSNKSNGQMYKILCRKNIFNDLNEQKKSFALSRNSSREVYKEQAIQKLEEANYTFSK